MQGSFSLAISTKQQEKHHFCIGDKLCGTAWTKLHPESEFADYYKAGALVKTPAATPVPEDTPPFRSEVPDLYTYAWRGCRMLDRTCFKKKCFQCKWAAMANVTIEYNFGKTQKHRFESFCYGPLSCRFYKMGRPRAVPYQGKDSDYDDGWLDELCVENRMAEIDEDE